MSDEDGSDNGEASSLPANLADAVQQLFKQKRRKLFRSQAARTPHPQIGILSALADTDCAQIEVRNASTNSVLQQIKGRFMSQMQTGVQFQRIRGSRGCFVQMTDNNEYKVGIRGGIRGSAEAQTQNSISFFRTGQAFSVSGLNLKPGQEESFHIGNQLLSYIPGARSTPTIRLATDQRTGEDAAYEIKNLALEAGRSFSIRVEEGKQVAFHQEGTAQLGFAIHALVSKGKERKNYQLDQVQTDSAGWAVMDFKRAIESLEMRIKPLSEH